MIWRLYVNIIGSNNSADLGDSSKESSEILDGRSENGFLVNSFWTRVNRS